MSIIQRSSAKSWLEDRAHAHEKPAASFHPVSITWFIENVHHLCPHPCVTQLLFKQRGCFIADTSTGRIGLFFFNHICSSSILR